MTSMKTAILLIEDDDISRIFLSEAITLLDVTLTACTCFAEAFAFLSDHRVDLIISDLKLPDGDLFGKAAGFPDRVPVLATSAEVTPDIREHLTGIGIREVLPKPMTVPALHEAIVRLCGPEPAVWNQAKALKALGGSRNALQRMQAMFLAELPVASDGVRAAFESGNLAVLQDTLHRLKASCGFLGAEHLLSACQSLDRQPSSKVAYQAFQTCLEETQAVIRASDG